MAREKKSYRLKPVAFIACEGTNTEYDYFSSFVKTDVVKQNFEFVDVYPSENEETPKTTPFQLMEVAREKLNAESPNFAWIVFDEDNHPRLADTFDQAAENGIRIGFSSRSFEVWVLMHYFKENNPFDASECKLNAKPINCGTPECPACSPIDCLSGHIRRQNFIPNYSKKQEFDLFATIYDRTEIAIVNSAWLRFRIGASLNNPLRPALHTLNPYVDVDQLILFLLGRHDIIEWGLAATDTELNGWIINSQIIGPNIVLQISHKKPKAVILKKQIENGIFFTTDDELNNTPCAIISKVLNVSVNGSNEILLYPNDKITYTLQHNNQPYFLFNYPGESTRIYIAL